MLKRLCWTIGLVLSFLLGSRAYADPAAHLHDAVAQGKVSVEVTAIGGSTGDTIQVSVKRLGTDVLRLDVAPGTVFRSVTGTVQDMVGARIKGERAASSSYAVASEMNLADDAAHVYVIEAFCLDFHKANPAAGDRFRMEGPSAELAPMLTATSTAGRSTEQVQAALWIKRDGIGDAELSARFPVSAEDLKAARAWVVSGPPPTGAAPAAPTQATSGPDESFTPVPVSPEEAKSLPGGSLPGFRNSISMMMNLLDDEGNLRPNAQEDSDAWRAAVAGVSGGTPEARLRTVRKLVGALGEPRARKLGVVFHDGSGVPTYRWPPSSSSPLPESPLSKASPAKTDAAVVGPWEFTVVGFEVRESFSAQIPVNPVEVVATEPGKKVAVVSVRCRATRKYTDDEARRVRASSIGKAALDMSDAMAKGGGPSLCSGDTALANQCFYLGHAQDPGAAGPKTDLKLLECDVWMRDRGGVGGFAIGKSGAKRVMVEYANVGDEIEARLVFANWPSGHVPLVLFQPFFDSEMKLAKLTLRDDGSLASAEYGELESLKKYVRPRAEPAPGESSHQADGFFIRSSFFDNLKTTAKAGIVLTFDVMGGKLSIGGDSLEDIGDPFRYGIEHRYMNDVTMDFGGEKYVIHATRSEPVVFMAVKDKGYVYIRGRGSVTLPDGTTIQFPPMAPSPKQSNSSLGDFDTIIPIRTYPVFPEDPIEKMGVVQLGIPAQGLAMMAKLEAVADGKDDAASTRALLKMTLLRDAFLMQSRIGEPKIFDSMLAALEADDDGKFVFQANVTGAAKLLWNAVHIGIADTELPKMLEHWKAVREASSAKAQQKPIEAMQSQLNALTK